MLTNEEELIYKCTFCQEMHEDETSNCESGGASDIEIMAKNELL